MIAYNNNWLDNLFIQEQTTHAFDIDCIIKTEQENIHSQHPAGFFTPNLFIRIGLFLLTLVIAIFSYGLLSLFLMQALENSIAGIIIFYGLLTYAALEFMIKNKHYFKAGVDDALIWMSAGMLFGGISYGVDATPLAMCCIAFCMACFYTVRFADRLMALIAFLAYLGLLFFTCAQLGGIVKAIVPFVIMIASAVIYFFTKSIAKQHALRHYATCFTMLEFAALIAFYIGGNYFVVRELSNSMFNLNLRAGESIPYATVFWMFTILTPLVYLLIGIRRKNNVLIRTGLILVAATVYTIRYYYHVADIEITMTIVGIIMIVTAGALIRYLKTPKFGFTYHASKGANQTGSLQIESLVIAETFSIPDDPQSGTQFGGGSFGGGGAGSQF
ncbi:hypothetical protein BH10BAC3_BH10BAC3_23040 [soil metagenome]